MGCCVEWSLVGLVSSVGRNDDGEEEPRSRFYVVFAVFNERSCGRRVVSCMVWLNEERKVLMVAV